MASGAASGPALAFACFPVEELSLWALGLFLALASASRVALPFSQRISALWLINALALASVSVVLSNSLVFTVVASSFVLGQAEGQSAGRRAAHIPDDNLNDVAPAPEIRFLKGQCVVFRVWFSFLDEFAVQVNFVFSGCCEGEDGGVLRAICEELDGVGGPIRFRKDLELG